MTYIHQRPGWPKLTWDTEALAGALAAVRHKQGRHLGKMESLGFDLRAEASLTVLTDEVVKSSAIEGEHLNPEEVRSSIARRLGLDLAGLPRPSRDVEGVVEMMLDATRNFDAPLTEERLFGWHAALFPTGRSGMQRITAGAWRDHAKGPMQVVSGPMRRQSVHYEAPPAQLLDAEMTKFIEWVNPPDGIDPVLKSAIAHFWFVAIHPFDDGNGRIARAIADWILARSEKSSQRFYSMSAQIRLERNAYYDILERTQKETLDITAWLQWFIDCFDRALDATEKTLASVLRKARFWETHASAAINERQRLVLNKLLNGLEGELTSSKWAKLAKCSQDTA